MDDAVKHITSPINFSLNLKKCVSPTYMGYSHFDHNILWFCRAPFIHSSDIIKTWQLLQHQESGNWIIHPMYFTHFLLRKYMNLNPSYHVWIKGIFSDSNIFLCHELKVIKGRKGLFPKFQLIQILRFSSYIYHTTLLIK